MKYKLLLVGKQLTLIDDFFNSMNEEYILFTSSTRLEDMTNHVKYIQPDAVVYCVFSESRDDMIKISAIREELDKHKIPFILIGAKEDVDDFHRIATSVTHLTLLKPLTASIIKEKLHLFFKEREAAAEEEARLLYQAQLEAEREKERNRRRHVLVVDDDPLILRLIKEYLKDEFEVGTAINGRVALKFLEKKETDIILLDYQMPDETGPEVFIKIRENEKTKDIPIIFFTGMTERNKIKQVLALKPQGYLLKPVDREKLHEAIRKNLV